MRPDPSGHGRSVRFINAVDGALLGFELRLPRTDELAHQVCPMLERMRIERLLTRCSVRGDIATFRYCISPREGLRLDANQSRELRTALLVLVATGYWGPRRGVRRAVPRDHHGGAIQDASRTA